MGFIRLKNIKLDGYHGCFPEEKKLGQPFEIDVEINLNLQDAVKKDRLPLTMDYSNIYQTVENVFTGSKFNLIETAADRVAEAVMALDSFNSVTVRVRKISAPIAGAFDAIEVEITRCSEND